MSILGRTIRVIAVSAAAAVIVVGILVERTTSTAQEEQAARYIAQPPEWVALSYDHETKIDGVPTFTYTSHRLADGSTRRERHDGEEISILNMSLGKYYRFHHGWSEHPMRPQPAGGKPYLRLDRKRVTEVLPTDPRVQLVATDVAAMPVRFYEMRMSASHTAIFCPELNLLEVWSLRQRQNSTIEERVTRVRLQEPTVEFRPPSGAPVAVGREPAGPGQTSRAR